MLLKLEICHNTADTVSIGSYTMEILRPEQLKISIKQQSILLQASWISVEELSIVLHADQSISILRN